MNGSLSSSAGKEGDPSGENERWSWEASGGEAVRGLGPSKAKRGGNLMKDFELSLEIASKKRGISVSDEKLELDKGDTLKWKRKDPHASFSFKVIFPEHSPFAKSEFVMAGNGETDAPKVIYSPGTSGWKKFKYVIVAYNEPDLHYLDPELIIPKNARQ
jgi:hypothetical protein